MWQDCPITMWKRHRSTLFAVQAEIEELSRLLGPRLQRPATEACHESKACEARRAGDAEVPLHENGSCRCGLQGLTVIRETSIFDIWAKTTWMVDVKEAKATTSSASAAPNTNVTEKSSATLALTVETL